jgi:hypothetical protein
MIINLYKNIYISGTGLLCWFRSASASKVICAYLLPKLRNILHVEEKNSLPLPVIELGFPGQVRSQTLY